MSTGKRMRVLHVGKFYPPVSGGMERVLKLLCDREKAFVDTRVLVANTAAETVHETVDGVPVTRVAVHGSAGSVAICPAFPYWLARQDADVIVIHEPNPIGLLAYALARPRGRLIVWFHSEVVRPGLQYRLFYRPWFAHAMRRASRVIIASPPMAAAAQLQGFPVSTSVIPYGIDEDAMRPTPDVLRRAAELRQRFAGPIALCVGRMVPYKGLDVLLRAMTRVDAGLVLVGNGPLADTLHASAQTAGISGKVHFAGEVDDRELLAWYHACDFFVLPSTTRAEAFGVVQTEAMACGRPVVSTSLPTGVPWVNRHMETGLVVPPGDDRALALALNTLAADKALCERLGAGGRARVAAEFTADRMAARAMEVYRDALLDAGGAAAVDAARVSARADVA
jgi:glycosyltransferase involved in cell wall biosynthesis